MTDHDPTCPKRNPNNQAPCICGAEGRAWRRAAVEKIRRGLEGLGRLGPAEIEALDRLEGAKHRREIVVPPRLRDRTSAAARKALPDLIDFAFGRYMGREAARRIAARLEELGRGEDEEGCS